VTVDLYLGIDIGTSGIRGCCIDEEGEEIASHAIALQTPAARDGRNEQDPHNWLKQLDRLLCAVRDKLSQIDAQIIAISIDGTSSTLIACDRDGEPLSPALMYNDQQAQRKAEQIAHFAPAESAVHGASSSLAKAMLLLERYPRAARLCHQADWLSARLSGRFDVSDENNCLKLGYDSLNNCWPSWLSESTGLAPELFPEVVPAGNMIGPVRDEYIDRYALSADCVVVAGTTDSNAAALAATGAGGESEIGDAVTSLGSTLAIKLFTSTPLFAPQYGIYSHHLNGHWLVGGASNTGGAVLLQHFTRQQLDAMTPQLDPDNDTGLDYYPLPATGERFPVCDPDKQSKITPRPDNDIKFFQGLLEGMARIEADAYDKLSELGADRPKRIFTAGGGNRNDAWMRIRERMTGVPVLKAKHSEASYGSALLARQAVLKAEC
jgi:sugar (pentulose or hexulose) kinase